MSLLPCTVMADESLTLDTPLVIDWGSDLDKYYTFTPGETGSYAVLAESTLNPGGSWGSYVEIYEVMPTGGGNYETETGWMVADVFTLEKDTEYRIHVPKNEAISTTVTIQKAEGFPEMSKKAETLKLNEEKKVTVPDSNRAYMDLMLKIVIDSKGSYRFIQKNLKDISIYRENGEDVSPNYGKDTFDFAMDAGTYYIAYEYHAQDDRDDPGIERSVLIKKSPKTEGILLENRTENDSFFFPLYYGDDGDGGTGDWVKDAAGNRLYFEFKKEYIASQFVK